MTDLNRRENETDFEWKLRCCLAKKRGETDMDWIEIRDMLGLNITPDQLRKISVGYAEYDDYLNGNSGVALLFYLFLIYMFHFSCRLNH